MIITIPITKRNVLGWALGLTILWFIITYSWVICGVITATIMWLASGVMQ